MELRKLKYNERSSSQNNKHEVQQRVWLTHHTAQANGLLNITDCIVPYNRVHSCKPTNRLTVGRQIGFSTSLCKFVALNKLILYPKHSNHVASRLFGAGESFLQ